MDISAKTRIRDEDDVITYYCLFLTLGNPLFNKQRISDSERSVEFFRGCYSLRNPTTPYVSHMISKMSLHQLEDIFLAYIYVTIYYASFAMAPLTSESSIMWSPINGCDDHLDARIVIRGATGLGKTATQ